MKNFEKAGSFININEVFKFFSESKMATRGLNERRFFKIFLKLAEVLIPHDEDDEGASGPDFESRAVEFFENMPPRARFTFSMILFLVELNSIITRFKPFSSLSREEREIFVEKWANSKLMAKRVMISAMKGLISMIYISLEKSMHELKKYDKTCLAEESFRQLTQS